MKNKKLLWFLLPIFIAGLFYFIAHTFNSPLVTRQIQQNTFTQINTSSSTNTMKIVSVEPYNTGQYCNAPSCTELGANNVKILLKGPVVVTGTYSYINSESGFSGYCMEGFDRGFLGTLPFELSNQEVKIFCFVNKTFAEEKLGKEKKTVTVVIDNFEFISYPSEVMHGADLVEVKF